MTQNQKLDPHGEFRKAVVEQYGSWENHKLKQELIKEHNNVAKKIKEYQRSHRAYHLSEEELLDVVGEDYWFRNPFRLKDLPLGVLGAPWGSDEWHRLMKTGPIWGEVEPEDYDGETRDNRSAGLREVGTQMAVVDLWEEVEGGFRQIGTTERRWSWEGVERWSLRPFREDYAEFGWPKEAGTPIRIVTPEEHREILRRLSQPTLGLGKAVEAVSLEQLLEMPEEEERWIIEGLIRHGGAAMIYGGPGIGKTWLTHTLVMLAALGKHRTIEGEVGAMLRAGPEPVKVMVLDGEMTQADLGKRAKKLAAMLGAEPKEFRGVELAMKTTQELKTEFPDLVDEAWKEAVVRFCKATDTKLLVLDNLSTLCPSLEDENSATAWNPLNELVVSLKKEGVATLICHHTNKNGKGYRGSSAIATTLETVIRLDRPEGPQETGVARFGVVVEKNRGGHLIHLDGKTMTLKDDRWVFEVDEIDVAERVVQMVKSFKYRSQQEIAEVLGCDQSKVSRIFRAAEMKGLGTVAELKECLRTAKAYAEDSEPEELNI